MSKTKEEVIEALTVAIPYFRAAIITAAEEYPDADIKMAIISRNADGSGNIGMAFDCEEFFDDIAFLIGLDEQTVEDNMAFKAHRFLSEHGLTVNRDE